MKTLYEAILSTNYSTANAICGHLRDFGIREWSDCTKLNLSDFVAYLTDRVCQSSACNYTAILKSVLNRYSEEGVVPCTNIRDALRCKNEKSQKIWLDESDLVKLERTIPMSQNERFVKLCFLISAKTGMRISDALKITEENISDGMLTYVSEKTSIEASVPVSDKVVGWIRQVCEIESRPNLGNYEIILRRICKRAGITDRVKVFKAGEERVGEKWKFITSHTARVSFASILASKDIPTRTIMTLMGHTSEDMTQRYIAYKGVNQNLRIMNFFK